MELATLMSLGNRSQLTADEVKKALYHYDGTVVRLIAHCKSREQQEHLIALWNDPLELEQFLEQATEVACSMLMEREVANAY